MFAYSQYTGNVWRITGATPHGDYIVTRIGWYDHDGTFSDALRYTGHIPVHWPIADTREDVVSKLKESGWIK